MPVYSYACERCGATFEIRRRMSEDGAVRCATCRSRRVRRVYDLQFMGIDESKRERHKEHIKGKY